MSTQPELAMHYFPFVNISILQAAAVVVVVAAASLAAAAASAEDAVARKPTAHFVRRSTWGSDIDALHAVFLYIALAAND